MHADNIALSALSACTSNDRQWYTQNGLQLNPDKSGRNDPQATASATTLGSCFKRQDNQTPSCCFTDYTGCRSSRDHLQHGRADVQGLELRNTNLPQPLHTDMRVCAEFSLI